jgi:site-specific DNA-methyltransferase (adenine-specific)
MHAKWDYDVPSVEIWKECLRVLKPGGHLLSFGGSRTYHRMAVRIEDAGFEIRDQIMWVYGSGFPKSHNIGKAVDKLQGNDREVVGERPQRANSKDEEYRMNNSINDVEIVTKGTSEWEGWGTALKPAHEPIVMARKPLSEKTVAENVLRWGTGGINIDDSRIGTDDILGREQKSSHEYAMLQGGYNDGYWDNTKGLGRWPANIIFDEEAGQVLDQQSGIRKTGGVKTQVDNGANQPINIGGGLTKQREASEGGASRFYYCPKASKKDRDEGMDGFEETISEIAQINSQTKLQPNGEYVENKVLPRKNNHPTVKPTALMLYLIKLVTPVNGTVLDCFLGSGSTGKAAIRGGFDFIGIEREEEYIKIAEARIKNEMNG